MPSILDRSFVYHNAASHTSPDAFRERMRQRMDAAKDWQEEKARKSQWARRDGLEALRTILAP